MGHADVGVVSACSGCSDEDEIRLQACLCMRAAYQFTPDAKSLERAGYS